MLLNYIGSVQGLWPNRTLWRGKGLQSKPKESYSASPFLSLCGKILVGSTSCSSDYSHSSQPAHIMKSHPHPKHVCSKINTWQMTSWMMCLINMVSISVATPHKKLILVNSIQLKWCVDTTHKAKHTIYEPQSQSCHYTELCAVLTRASRRRGKYGNQYMAATNVTFYCIHTNVFPETRCLFRKPYFCSLR